jgi:hypothetical protein
LEKVEQVDQKDKKPQSKVEICIISEASKIPIAFFFLLSYNSIHEAKDGKVLVENPFHHLLVFCSFALSFTRYPMTLPGRKVMESSF